MVSFNSEYHDLLIDASHAIAGTKYTPKIYGFSGEVRMNCLPLFYSPLNEIEENDFRPLKRKLWGAISQNVILDLQGGGTLRFRARQNFLLPTNLIIFPGVPTKSNCD